MRDSARPPAVFAGDFHQDSRLLLHLRSLSVRSSAYADPDQPNGGLDAAGGDLDDVAVNDVRHPILEWVFVEVRRRTKVIRSGARRGLGPHPGLGGARAGEPQPGTCMTMTPKVVAETERLPRAIAAGR
jgi:hypothetical protein